MGTSLFFAAASAPAAGAEPGGSQAALALLVLIIIAIAWIALRGFIRSLRAGRTQEATGGRYPAYVREALVNAAKIDGRATAPEIEAIAKAFTEATGAAFDPPVIENAIAHAKLSKDELVAFLASRSGAFSYDQKVALLKALLSVFVADGRFDASEHAALVDYTAAVGFDRQTAPDMLSGLAQQFRRGNIT